jgi:zinc transporter ZupT
VSVNVWTVMLAAALTAVATGIGALPLAVVPRGNAGGLLRLGNAIAAVLMLGASAGLLWQGVELGPLRTGTGVVLGAGAILLFRRALGERDDLVIGRLAGPDAVKALAIVAVMTAHSFSEGIGIGVSYGEGDRFGILITLVIALHNIPEGLAIGVVLVPRGAGVGAAVGWSVFSSLPQPLIAPVAFLFVEEFHAVLPVGLGVAAGAMIWVVAAELLPGLLVRQQVLR